MIPSCVGSNPAAPANKLIDNFADATFYVGSKVKALGEIFGDFFKQLQADILKITLKQGLFGDNGSGGLLGGLFGKMGGSSGEGLGSIFGGFFAKGGTARAGKVHIVGDGGEPELFIPNSKAVSYLLTNWKRQKRKAVILLLI